ncbi:MAG: hypothetical protein LBK61_03640 [Spirochaetaceae bacterium]|jgi:hypothetical protein|nr:hypothetical protein [Spirochaetaceae bacterium]
MLMDPYRMSLVTGDFSGTVPGYHDIALNKTRSWFSTVPISSLLRDPAYHWVSYIYTDSETDISYDVADGKLVFTGVPSYRFFQIDDDNETVTQNRRLNTAIMLRNIHIKYINPVVFRSAEQTAQWTAFFRAVRERDPDGWTRFIDQIAGITPEPAMGIPRAREP